MMGKKNDHHHNTQALLEIVQQRLPEMPEYTQAIREVAQDVLGDDLAREELARRWEILRYLAEPDRVINFRVNWQDDRNQIHSIQVGVKRPT